MQMTLQQEFDRTADAYEDDMDEILECELHIAVIIATLHDDMFKY